MALNGWCQLYDEEVLEKSGGIWDEFKELVAFFFSFWGGRGSAHLGLAVLCGRSPRCCLRRRCAWGCYVGYIGGVGGGGVCWGVRRGSCQTGVADPMQWGEHENSISPCVVFKARSRREQRTAPTPQDVLDWSHADGSLVARRSTKIPTAAIGNQIIILKLKSQPTWSVSSLLCEGFMFHSRFSKVPATSVNSIEAESRFFFFTDIHSKQANEMSGNPFRFIIILLQSSTLLFKLCQLLVSESRYSAEQQLMSMFSASSECQSNSGCPYHLCIYGLYSEDVLRKATWMTKRTMGMFALLLYFHSTIIYL